MTSTTKQPRTALLSTPVLLLAAVAFVIGTAEFVAIGLVPELARDLDVSVTAAGSTVTVYALAVALLAIPLGLWLARKDPRILLPGLLLFFAVANVVAALAPGLGVLLAARVASAAVQGVALGVAVSAVTTMVREDEKGKAVSLVFGGLMSAMFLGAPIGTLLSGMAGWRSVFVALAVLGVALAVALRTTLAGGTSSDEGLSGVAQLRILSIPGVAGLLGVAAAFVFVSNILLPYLGAYLEEVADVGAGGISVGLGAFGVAGLVGNALGGFLSGRADRLWVAVLAGIAVLGVVGVGLGDGRLGVILPSLALWGVAQMAALPIVTTELVGLGGAFAATLNVAMVNLGIAVAGFGGGFFADGSIELLPWITAGAFGILAITLMVRHFMPTKQSV